MKISILHPSYQRPDMAAGTAHKWLIRAKNPEKIEYILALSKPDRTIRQYEAAFSDLPIRTVVYDKAHMIETVNFAANQSTGELLIVVSDDFDCPQMWDVLLLNALQGKSDYVVKTQDGLQPFIITLPIMDRKYFNRFHYIYNPVYQHMFSDNELADVGQLLNRTINLPILFRHLHYSTGAMQRDETNIKNDNTFLHDQQIYLMRKANNFYL